MGRLGCAKAPSLLLTLAECRAVFELQSFYALRMLMKKFPKGDGHPVLVLPGFLASDTSTLPLRKVLKDLGYNAYGWKLGRNLTFNPEREQQMHDRVMDIYRREGRQISIIGWSLGGVFAREIAKFMPEKTRSVISLGSPIIGDTDYSNAKTLFEAINGKPEGEYVERYERSHEAPPVPTTSIYSKSDGIVSWQGSIQEPGHQTENIEVPASHFGLGFNPAVIYAVADRLAQAEGEWAPFVPAGPAKLIYSIPSVPEAMPA